MIVEALASMGLSGAATTVVELILIAGLLWGIKDHFANKK
jgi:hypothetical protein